MEKSARLNCKLFLSLSVASITRPEYNHLIKTETNLMFPNIARGRPQVAVNDYLPGMHPATDLLEVEYLFTDDFVRLDLPARAIDGMGVRHKFRAHNK